MSKKIFQNHNHVIFRFYTVIVIGLIIIAALLDYGFGFLQKPQTPEKNQWIENTFILIENKLLNLDVSETEHEIKNIEKALSININIFPSDSVIFDTPEHSFQEVDNKTEKSEYIYHSKKLDAVIHLISINSFNANESVLFRLVPPLFYLAILILAGVWFRPLLKDLDLLTRSASAFAKDYRQPLGQLEKTSALNELASNFHNMALKIRASIQAQKDLTNALSHELRTPLARIKFALAIDHKNNQNNTESLSINKDIEEMDKIISYMLNYARLDHFETKANKQPIPIAAWLLTFTEKCINPSIKLETNNLSKQETVCLDPYLMELAISNLLVNAERYAKSQVVINFNQLKNYYYLIIEDDGEGVPNKDHSKIFDAYTRLDNEINREKNGFGLGLAIAARVATLHKGQIYMEDSLLGGAKFIIKWPVSVE